MEQQRPQFNGCGIVFGLFLMAVGGVFLAEQYMDIGVWDWFARIPWEWAWTGFILVPGAIMLLFGLFGPRDSAGLAIPGSIVTTVGLVLAAQAVTGAWASWSYAWTLIWAAVGMGLFLFGVRAGKSEVRRVGGIMLALGLVAFVAFAFFFEVVIGVGGFLGEAARAAVFPALVIVAGVLIVVSSTRRRSGPGTATTVAPPAAGPTPEAPAETPPSD